MNVKQKKMKKLKKTSCLLLVICLVLTGCQKVEEKSATSSAYNTYDSSEKINESELSEEANNELNKLKKDDQVHIYFDGNNYLIQFNSKENIQYLDQKSMFDSQNIYNMYFETSKIEKTNSFYGIYTFKDSEKAENLKIKIHLNDKELKFEKKDVDYKIIKE